MGFESTNTNIVCEGALNYLAKINHLTIWPVWLNRWVFVHELGGWGFESHCSHLNLRYCVCFEQGVPWHLGNYRVQINSKMRMWHDKTLSLLVILAVFLSAFSCIHFMSIFFSRHRHLSRGHRISCPTHHPERTDNKPFRGLIAPRPIIKNRVVTSQSWVARFCHRALLFS